MYTALGSDVTFIEALDKLMPGFDGEVAKMAQRILITPRHIDFHTGVLAAKVTPGVPGVKPVVVELVDFKTKAPVGTLEMDAVLVATGRAPFTEGLNLGVVGAAPDRRGFVVVDERMRVLDTQGAAVEGLWCIGDANGRMMLAHAASAQGISAVENMCGRPHVLNHLAVPAACFTHPEISFAGLTQEQADARGAAEGFEVRTTKTAFKSNTKALAEGEPDGFAKVVYNGATGEILGVHIIGLHAADLIHEASNAIFAKQTVQNLKFNVHAHPTLSEVLDETYKASHVGVAGKHLVAH